MFLSDITALFCAGQTCELYSRAEPSPLWAPCDINGNAPVRMLLNMGSLRSSSLESLSHHGTTPAIPQAPPGSPSWNQSLCSSSAETHTHTQRHALHSVRDEWWLPNIRVHTPCLPSSFVYRPPSLLLLTLLVSLQSHTLHSVLSHFWQIKGWISLQTCPRS